MRGKLQRLAFGVVAALLLAELGLRLSGRLETYSESNFGVYRSVLGSTKPSWLHLRTPSTSQQYTTADFAFALDTNREGMRDVEHLEANPQGLWRVVALGDSYTEGVGAAFEDSWPQRLAERLRTRGLPVELLQAGVAGSDPFFSFALLEQQLLPYRPRLVLFLLNATDLCDTLWWGGTERFLPDGTSRARPAPWFEPFYRVSHLVRLVVHQSYDWRMVRKATAAAANRDAEARIVELLERAQALGRREGFTIWVGVHPTPDEVHAHTRPFSQSFFGELRARGIPAADLSPGMETALGDLALTDYSWPVDRHYNARGYGVLAELVERELAEAELLPQVPR